MTKLTLTFVGRYTTKRDGTPLVTKAGKPYTSLRIKCAEYGDQFISGFDNATTRDWKVGDTVEAEVEKKGEYLNFSTPKPTGGLSQDDKDMLQKMYREIYAIRETMVVIKQLLEANGSIEKPEYPESNGATAFDEPEEVKAEDIPW